MAILHFILNVRVAIHRVILTKKFLRISKTLFGSMWMTELKMMKIYHNLNL
ncbi:hypothetical protein BMS3Abin08_01974 [bacterium BMS3Abin08]|nr:hypothetical protein BMS3Abin08_01974 [bacterium BMS3Abin08]